jgi:hypothetical protein
MRVNYGGCEAIVAKEALDISNVGFSFQKMYCIAMAQLLK